MKCTRAQYTSLYSKFVKLGGNCKKIQDPNFEDASNFDQER